MSSEPKGSAQQAAPWGRLKAWICEKEAWERQHKRPAPLSQRELTAIANLVSFIPEPDVGDEDHVSALLRYVQARQLDRPTFTEEGPLDITVNGLKESRWRYFCWLTSVDGRFPREGHGWAPREEPPAFKSKKTAKQFAAQQALEYLQEWSPSPKNTPDSSPAGVPGPSTPLAKRVKLEDQPIPGMSPQNTANSSAKKLPPSPEGDVSPGPTVFECVARLASRLGLDQPVYQIEPEGGMPKFYWGRAKFKPSSKVPDDIGLVRHMLARKEAKVQVATKVLVWLQQEEQARQNAIEVS